MSKTGEGVVVYSYYTYLATRGRLVPVQSLRPATLELIESIGAVPVMGSEHMARRADVCELGFLRSRALGPAPTQRAQ